MASQHGSGHFNRWARTYESSWMQSVIFEPVQSTVLELAAREVAQPAAILDICCGTGRLLRSVEQRFPTAELAGIDAADGMVSQARNALPVGSRIVVQLATAEALPFADARFDLVFSTMTFHHWTDCRRPAERLD